MMEVFLIVSIVFNMGLLYKLLSTKKAVKYIYDALREVRELGFDRRLHLGLRYRSLKILGTELNMLMDRFQEILEEKQRLEISHKQLTANISHDIRTPLTSILGYVEVLKKVDSLNQEERKNYLDVIQAKGQALYRIIQEFFDLSKLDSEDTKINIQRIDVTEKIREVLVSFYQDFKTSGITPSIDIPEEPVFVQGDAICLERILHNLMSNALKYGMDGGIIGINLRKNEEENKAWIDIWDKGKGINEKDIPFVFDRLYTSEFSRSDGLRGNGLGLAIVKQLVEKQNGEIRVTSIPGGKTTFSFYLRNL